MIRSTTAGTPEHYCAACEIWVSSRDIKAHRKSHPHIDICKNRDLYYCHSCDRAFLNDGGFEAHNKSSHNMMPVSQRHCKACDIWIDDRNSKIHKKPQPHMDICKRKGIYYCRPCDKAFLGGAGLGAHNMSCHPPAVPVAPPGMPAILGNSRNGTNSQPQPSSVSSSTPTLGPNSTAPQHFRKYASTSQTLPIIQQDVPRGSFCAACNTRVQFTAIREHLMSMEHIAKCKPMGLYCVPCQKPFLNNFGMNVHKNAVHKISNCSICHVDFPTNIVKDHELSQSHIEACKEVGLYCAGCKLTFHSKRLIDIHLRTTHDPSRPSAFYCCDCDQTFPSNSQFIKHLRGGCILKEKTFKCDPCDLAFSTKEQLNQHLNSKSHKTLTCLGSTSCKRKFKDLSGMIQHLESGACVSKFNRATIDSLVRSHDSVGVITIKDCPTPALSLTGLNGSYFGSRPPVLNDSGEEGVIITPATAFTPATVFTPTSTLSRRISTGTTPADILTPTISESEIQLANSKCCPICKRTFASIGGLQMHIASPVHAVPIYHCPMDFLGELGLENKNKKEREFRTLSGLTQHIEAGACSGGKKTWEKAIEFLQVKLAGFGFAGIKLLGQ